ncbi:hypothetical protein FEM48_Zijuj07G0003300 [Ziziphus jujuba var. spinosa]|uniref:methenyltetrahydrofolate cyclohydrolase n=1 Tax=Ziziphus jujuba var. spinosa TaxID=714518 RepID=A0A978V1C3_ZIZJJ|nr:hypothetical protein FEM48_Zijuj07G0003300 [Ziziphus jujuba var. spinosa]
MDLAKEIQKEIGDEIGRMKESIGVVPDLFTENSLEKRILDCISELNHDPLIHGILVHNMNKKNILNAINTEKDVDGLHPLNHEYLESEIIKLLLNNVVRGKVLVSDSPQRNQPEEDTNSSLGSKLVGDVCYEEVSKIASAISPVPGRVGPMTIAMLLSNALVAAKRTQNFR